MRGFSFILVFAFFLIFLNLSNISAGPIPSSYYSLEEKYYLSHALNHALKDGIDGGISIGVGKRANELAIFALGKLAGAAATGGAATPKAIAEIKAEAMDRRKLRVAVQSEVREALAGYEAYVTGFEPGGVVSCGRPAIDKATCDACMPFSADYCGLGVEVDYRDGVDFDEVFGSDDFASADFTAILEAVFTERVTFSQPITTSVNSGRIGVSFAVVFPYDSVDKRSGVSGQ
ncbi:hypothetical protein COX84_02510 [Candidatus Micrarchaeota archaeon CG_4_10_14_0_2_um_filter_49_7]|nr:MAG: hypothetical protein COX84_02510 [Candidatus Micrarchaeota archaeon CG_4_10_14_0_2_um_filter_49_7]HII53586.1 hypothetical protein [Candidatus Micrarchaeota archaeon]